MKRRSWIDLCWMKDVIVNVVEQELIQEWNKCFVLMLFVEMNLWNEMEKELVERSLNWINVLK